MTARKQKQTILMNVIDLFLAQKNKLGKGKKKILYEGVVALLYKIRGERKKICLKLSVTA